MPHVEFTAADGARVPTYLALPPVTPAPWPGVVVVHDAMGLSDDCCAHADHLAAAGYLAAAPDLYARGGKGLPAPLPPWPPERARCVREVFRSMVSGTGSAVDDLDILRRWLADRDDCTGRVGIIGFCLGGGFALLLAGKGFDTAAPNYGRLPADLAVLDGACPIVASYGARDRTLPGAAAALEAALTERGIPHDVKEYPEAGHSFLDRWNAGPLTPLLRVGGFGYHQRSAEDAWSRILRFFDQHLRAEGGDPTAL